MSKGIRGEEGVIRKLHLYKTYGKELPVEGSRGAQGAKLGTRPH